MTMKRFWNNIFRFLAFWRKREIVEIHTLQCFDWLSKRYTDLADVIGDPRIDFGAPYPQRYLACTVLFTHESLKTLIDDHLCIRGTNRYRIVYDKGNPTITKLLFEGWVSELPLEMPGEHQLLLGDIKFYLDDSKLYRKKNDTETTNKEF